MAAPATLRSRGRKSDQKLKGSEQMVQIDREGNVTRLGKIIGRITYEGGAFIGENYVTGKRVSDADYELVFAWLGGQS